MSRQGFGRRALMELLSDGQWHTHRECVKEMHHAGLRQTNAEMLLIYLRTLSLIQRRGLPLAYCYAKPGTRWLTP